MRCDRSWIRPEASPEACRDNPATELSFHCSHFILSNQDCQPVSSTIHLGDIPSAVSWFPFDKLAMHPFLYWCQGTRDFLERRNRQLHHWFDWLCPKRETMGISYAWVVQLLKVETWWAGKTPLLGLRHSKFRAPDWTSWKHAMNSGLDWKHRLDGI